MKMRFIAVAIILCVTPSALASWSAKGNYEPDTLLDKNSGYMFNDAVNAQKSTGNYVYFNAIQSNNIPPNLGAPVSANLATLQTQQMSTPYQAMALLGVWRDCNKDNVIGFGDNGLFEYRTELLLDTSICPKQSIPSNWGYPTYSDAGGIIHNDGTWIREFIPIGYDSHFARGTPGGNLNHYKVEDIGARVWGDFGLPGAPAGNICWLNPSPPGSYHTVGQIEDKMDCYAGFAIMNMVVPNLGPATATYNTVRATHNPWGEPSDASDATVFDCNTPVGPRVTASSAFTFQLHAPKVPPTTSTSGSVGGTVNETANGLDDCDRSKNDGERWEGQVSNLPYSQEQGTVSAQKSGEKIQTDQQFKFGQGVRGVSPFSTLGPGANKDAGTNTADPFGTWGTNSLCTTCNQYSRGTVSQSDPLGQFKVQHQTYYAFVSSKAVGDYGLTIPHANERYGAGPCGTSTTGIYNGWDCDKSHWYKNVDGSSSNQGDPNLGEATPDNPSNGGVAMGARPGDLYNLRDVDCFDQSVGPARDIGVSWGTLTGTKCA